MLSSDEFRLQRHMEIWKEQNKLIKRVIILTLIFGFLILTRILVPFNENTQELGKPIIKYKKEKNTLEAQNKIWQRLEDTSNSVQAIVHNQPWEKEKDKLIKKFQTIKPDEDPQKAANTTIGNIAGQIRNDIVTPLKSVFELDPNAAEMLPELSREIGNLESFIDDWETNHINVNWYATLYQKDATMEALTESLNQKMTSFSSLIKRKVDIINKEIDKRNGQIKDLESSIDQANADLERVLDEFFPKWVKVILSLEQMIQLYSLILLVVLLYVFWIIISLSRHYSYIDEKIRINHQAKTDFSTSSIWTFGGKTQSAAILTYILYILFVISIWILFENGLSLLDEWLKVADTDRIFMNTAILQPLKWIGRIVFLVTISAVLLNQRIKFFRRIST